MRKLAKWILSIFSEETGTGSESRVSSYTVIVGALALVWVSTLLCKDIPAAAEVVLLTLIGAVVGKYAVNKFQTPNCPTIPGITQGAADSKTSQTVPQTPGEAP